MSRRRSETDASSVRPLHPERNRDPELFVGPIRIPLGAIPANFAEQAPNDSYLPPVYYSDRDITCVDCGQVEVWTAEQQHWWYEVAKGPVDSVAVRCRACRSLRRAAKSEQRARSERGRDERQKR